MLVFALILITASASRVPDHFQVGNSIYIGVNDDEGFKEKYIEMCKEGSLTNCWEEEDIVTIQFYEGVTKDIRMKTLEETMQRLATLKDTNEEEFIAFVDNCINPSIWSKIKNTFSEESFDCFLAINAVSTTYKFMVVPIVFLKVVKFTIE